MSIQHYHTILCDQIIEAKDGKASLIGMYSNVRLAQLPGGLLRMWVHLEIDAEAGDAFEISVEDEDGASVAVLASQEITKDMLERIWGVSQQETTQTGQLNVTVSHGPVIFKRYGKHFVVLREGDRVVHRRAFSVVQQVQERGQNAQPVP